MSKPLKNRFCMICLIFLAILFGWENIMFSEKAGLVGLKECQNPPEPPKNAWAEPGLIYYGEPVRLMAKETKPSDEIHWYTMVNKKLMFMEAGSIIIVYPNETVEYFAYTYSQDKGCYSPEAKTVKVYVVKHKDNAKYEGKTHTTQIISHSSNRGCVKPTLMQLTRDSVSVMWEWINSDYGIVRFDTDPNFTNPEEVFSETMKRIHKVMLSPLEPNTTYYYMVFDSNNACYNWEDVDEGTNRFKTAPAVGDHTPFSFCVYGDTRIRSCDIGPIQTDPGWYGTERAIKAVRDFINEQSPAFVIHLGDFDHTGRSYDIIRRFFKWHRPLWKKSPLLPIYGNHEFQPTIYKNETCFYPGPYQGWDLSETLVDSYFTTTTYYATEYGNALFITLFIPYNTEGAIEWATRADQVNWLSSTLTNARESGKFDHIFVSFHRPIVLFGRDEKMDEVYYTYHDIFKEYGVTAVFQACKHNFQHILHESIHYFVSGGGGAPVYRTQSFTWPNHGFKLNSFADLNFIKVNINGTEASYEIYHVYWPGAWIIGEYKCDLEYSGNFDHSLPPRAATMENPEPGSTLSGSTATFKWDAGLNVQQYELWIGNELGGNDIFTGDSDGGLFIIVENLPVDGRKLYVTLRSRISGDWKERYYEYTAFKALNADFDYSIDGLKVYFTDLSTLENGKIKNWLWDFGDNTSSSEKNPIHTYSKCGIYNCTLKVFDEELSDSITKKIILPCDNFKITIPNGGENWQRKSYKNITWSSQGLSGNIKFILLRNDIQLGEIATNIPLGNGSYNWRVGKYLDIVTEPGTDYKIRIETMDGQYVDESDGLFTISDLKLTSPVGGENWLKGETREITWEWIYLGVKEVKIVLLKDHDQGLVGEIARNIQIENGLYNWEVGKYIGGTVEPGDNYKIRVETMDGNYYETSGFFSISAGGTITVTSPQASDNWMIGGTYTIQWYAQGSMNENVKIRVYQNGSHILNIVDNTPNDGSFDWTVPNNITPAFNYVIRVKTVDNLVYDDSDEFRITSGTITVTSPSIGITWFTGETYTITWDTQGSMNENVKIRVYQNSSHILSIVDSTPNDGSFSWTIPSNIPLASNYVIRVKTIDNLVYDDSDEFSITQGTITVTSPSGGATWFTGETYTITWDTQGNMNDNVKIRVYQNSSHILSIVDSTPNDGSFSWTIPSNIPPASNYVIRVKTIDNLVYDDSDEFSITQGTITVTSPSGGATWFTGETYTITWDIQGSMANTVKITLYDPSGTNLIHIMTMNTENDGIYSWTIPNDISPGNYIVRVKTTDNAVYDNSDEFTIN